MFTNADCTIFNKYYDASTRSDKWQRSIIKGVYWEDVSGQRSNNNGLIADCSALIIIPHNANFNGKSYVKPKAFKNSHLNAFTFAPDDIIVRGIINTDFSKLSDINALEDSHTILKSSDFLYGSANVQHWEVQSK